MTTINDILNENYNADIVKTNDGKVALFHAVERSELLDICKRFGHKLDVVVMGHDGNTKKLHRYTDDLSNETLYNCGYEDCTHHGNIHITTPDDIDFYLVIEGGDVAIDSPDKLAMVYNACELNTFTLTDIIEENGWDDLTFNEREVAADRWEKIIINDNGKAEVVDLEG